VKIIITNDDGIHSPALPILRDALRKYGDVEVVAPEREASASSHAITVHQPLRFYQTVLSDGSDGWAVTGTPADCVVLGMLKLGRPDLVVSGINPGANLGDDVTYSGTVGGAFEAALYGINAIAISVTDPENPNYKDAATAVQMVLDRIDDIEAPFLLNVNVPPTPTGAVRTTKMGRRLWSSNVHQRIDPRNKPYYWISGIPREVGDEGTDVHAVKKGFISVTPLKLDLTDHERMASLSAIFEKPKDL
jgi:5'-nucleotidase